jgi:hypothetical protein
MDKKSHSQIINLITDSNLEASNHINHRNVSEHYLNFKDTLNIISPEDINMKSQLKIVLSKFKDIKNGNISSHEIESLSSLNDNVIVLREHREFINDVDYIVNTLPQGNIDLSVFIDFLNQSKIDPTLVPTLIHKGKDLKNLPINELPHYSESVYRFAEHLSIKDVPSLTNLIDMGEVCHVLTYMCVEHKVILLLGTYGILYQCSLYNNGSSLPHFITDVRSSVATKVSYGYISVQSINDYFQNKVASDSIIYYMNNRSLITISVSISLFGIVSLLLSNNQGAIPITDLIPDISQVVGSIASNPIIPDVKQSLTLQEKYPLPNTPGYREFERLYNHNLQAGTGIFARWGHFISGLSRAFQDGILFHFNDYIDYADKAKDQAVEFYRNRRE